MPFAHTKKNNTCLNSKKLPANTFSKKKNISFDIIHNNANSKQKTCLLALAGFGDVVKSPTIKGVYMGSSEAMKYTHEARPGEFFYIVVTDR